MRFSELTPLQRIGVVLDAGSFEPSSPSGSLVHGRGRIGADQVYVAATDPAAARGAVGVAECRGMSELLARARDEGAPVVLLLDSSGARVDEGLPALGAFRGLLRETLLTRLARSPMLAVVGRACFGGASLLACTCGHRHYLTGARLAASGPAVIEGAVGAARFDARNHASVDALMGSAARVEIDAEGSLIEDAPDSVGSAVRGWLRDVQVQPQAWSPDAEHDLQGARLFATGAGGGAPERNRGHVSTSGRSSSARVPGASGGRRVLRVSADGIARSRIPRNAQRGTRWRCDLLAARGLAACAAS